MKFYFQHFTLVYFYFFGEKVGQVGTGPLGPSPCYNPVVGGTRSIYWIPRLFFPFFDFVFSALLLGKSSFSAFNSTQLSALCFCVICITGNPVYLSGASGSFQWRLKFESLIYEMLLSKKNPKQTSLKRKILCFSHFLFS